MPEPLQLLNVYDVEADDGKASLICFLDPVLAWARGIESRSVIGEYVGREGASFDAGRFQVNPPFIEALTGYMNERAATTEDIVAQAKTVTTGWLYVVDPRDPAAEGDDPATANLLGAFAVDQTGQVIPGSFQYNKNHTLFDPDHGTSGVFFDKKFYNWLHGFESGG